MKTTLRFLGLDAQDSWRRLVEQQLNELQSLTVMSAAKVVLERQPGFRSAFRVQVLLEVSGPNLRAEATDHTRQAALLKATQDLGRQIRDREFQRLRRDQGRPQAITISSRWARAPRPVERLEGKRAFLAAVGPRQNFPPGGPTIQ